MKFTTSFLAVLLLLASSVSHAHQMKKVRRASAVAHQLVFKVNQVVQRVFGQQGGGGGEHDPWSSPEGPCSNVEFSDTCSFEEDDLENDPLAGSFLKGMIPKLEHAAHLIDQVALYYPQPLSFMYKAQACSQVQSNIYLTNQGSNLVDVSGPSGLIHHQDFQMIINDCQYILFQLGC